MALSTAAQLKIPKIISSIAYSENLCYSDIANARSPARKEPFKYMPDILISLIIEELKKCTDEELLDLILKLLISENT